MTRIQETLLDLLKEELEYEDRDRDYNQWILGLSMKDKLARVVVKTNESPYVDGMDIGYTVNRNKIKGDQVSLEESYYENSPSLVGSPIKDALAWLEKHGEICYLQIHNPLDE